jgi:hypothetical protein
MTARKSEDHGGVKAVQSLIPDVPRWAVERSFRSWYRHDEFGEYVRIAAYANEIWRAASEAPACRVD